MQTTREEGALRAGESKQLPKTPLADASEDLDETHLFWGSVILSRAPVGGRDLSQQHFETQVFH